jgi:tetratricopeptide (TPR) repeat protein
VEAALSAGQYREAEQLMARWLSQEPDNHDARELLGRVYETKGDVAGAALQYTRALELMTAQAGEGHSDRCLTLYEKIKTLAPASPVLVRLAAALTPPPAVEVPCAPPPDTVPAEDEAQADSDADAHYTLGVAYKNMGLYQEAVDEFQRSMSGDAYYLDSCLMMALCFKEERQYAQAICMLEPVLFDPRSQSAKGQAIRYELGLLYEAEAQWEDATSTYQSIPSFHDVPQRLAALQGRHQPPAEGFRLAS